MNTSHHGGGAPDVFLKNASDVNRRSLHRMEQATEGIFYCTANQHDPDAEREDILRLQENHRAWHRIWVRASKELMQDMNGRLQLLELEGLK